MFNKVILIGRLGRDPELKTAQSGKSYCNFTLATNDGFGDNKRTDWHNVTAFGITAESICKYLKKGSICTIDGRIQYESYEKDGVKHNTTKIIADRATFIGSKADNDAQHEQCANKSASNDIEYQRPMSNDTFEGELLNEEIPF